VGWPPEKAVGKGVHADKSHLTPLGERPKAQSMLIRVYVCGHILDRVGKLALSRWPFSSEAERHSVKVEVVIS